MASTADLEAEGLLDGLEGEERTARIALLEELGRQGAGLTELREAAAEGRLPLLSVELAFAGEARYSPNEVSALSGVDTERLDAQWRALGMAVGDRDERTLSDQDLEAAKRVKSFLDAGLDPEGMLETARVMALAMSQVAAANRQMVIDLFARQGEEGEELSEAEIAGRLGGLARALVPMVGPALEHVYQLQLREQLRHAAVDEAVEAAGSETGELMAVGFADLVGFTNLGERLPPEEFGRISARLGELASEVAHGPIRLVKLIGDAVMLASSSPADLVDATLELVDLADDEGDDFPALRAGVALGRVIPRGGDFYGRPVNLASRLTGVARPGSLLVTADVKDRLADEYRFSSAGYKRLKGIHAPVEMFRCRDLDEDDEAGDHEDAGDATETRRTARRRRRRR